MSDHPEIPNGSYCHGATRADVCPHWSIDESRDELDNGFCALLNWGDWMHDQGIGLLWDQVKECGINVEEPGGAP